MVRRVGSDSDRLMSRRRGFMPAVFQRVYHSQEVVVIVQQSVEVVHTSGHRNCLQLDFIKFVFQQPPRFSRFRLLIS